MKSIVDFFSSSVARINARIQLREELENSPNKDHSARVRETGQTESVLRVPDQRGSTLVMSVESRGSRVGAECVLGVGTEKKRKGPDKRLSRGSWEQ